MKTNLAEGRNYGMTEFRHEKHEGHEGEFFWTGLTRLTALEGPIGVLLF
jgi:ribosomal 30S subunit maturation factor RimM